MIQKVTLKDIANDTELSISTVSRSPSQNGKISKDNEKKDFECDYRLNFPLTNSPTLAELRKSINIALIAKRYTGEFYTSLFDGFDKTTLNSKATIRLISVNHTSVAPVQILMELEKSKYDAAVIFLHNLISGYTSLIPVSLNVRDSSTELDNVFKKYYPNIAQQISQRQSH